MAIVDSHPPGTFCWVELATTDQNAAKEFYNALFGWTVTDFPMGADEVYTMFTLDSQNTGACYTMRPDLRARGVPPHWLLYGAVTSADETAARVAPAGGSIAAAPFDVMQFGRMAVLLDPAGAAIAMWQPKKHRGTGIQGVPGTLCWADLMTPDAQGAAKFYKDVFGWDTEPGESGYLHIKAGDQMIGGIPPAEHRAPGAPPHWLPYFLVQNCDSSTAKASSGGATVHMPPTTMEGVGRWSVVADPQGAVFALFQAAR